MSRDTLLHGWMRVDEPRKGSCPAVRIKVIGLPSERRGHLRLCSRGSPFTSIRVAIWQRGSPSVPPTPPNPLRFGFTAEVSVRLSVYRR